MARSILSDLNLWKAFETAVESGSYAEAGRALGEDATTVGRKVLSLEKELGFKLFEQSGRRLALSARGRLAYTRMKRLLEFSARTLDDLRSGRPLPGAELHLLASAGFANAFLRRAVSRFLLLHPQTLFRLETLRQSESYFDELGRGVDIIVTAFRTTIPGVTSVMVSDSPKYTLVSPAFLSVHGPLDNPSQLSGLPLGGNAHFARELTYRRESAEMACATENFRIFSDNSLFLADWAASGGGVFVGCPSALAADYVGEGRLVPVLRGWELPRLTGWAYASESALADPGSLVSAFLKMLRERNREVMGIAAKVLAGR